MSPWSPAFIAAALIISRATTGGSSTASSAAPAPSPETATKVQFGTSQRLVTKLESLSEEASTQEQATHLDQAAADLHNALVIFLMRSLGYSRAGEIFTRSTTQLPNRALHEAVPVLRPPKLGNAPNTFLTRRLRRDQL